MVPSSPFDIATSTLPEVMTCKRLPAALGEEELDVEAGLLEHALLLGGLQERRVPEAALRDRDLELVLRLRGRGEDAGQDRRSGNGGDERALEHWFPPLSLSAKSAANRHPATTGNIATW